jgi:hypothetical protein
MPERSPGIPRGDMSVPGDGIANVGKTEDTERSSFRVLRLSGQFCVVAHHTHTGRFRLIDGRAKVGQNRGSQTVKGRSGRETLNLRV